MARSRNIKPGFYKNEDLAECSVWARYIFPGLWMLADREGRLEDRPKRIKGELLPFDLQDIEPLLAELAARKFIVRYQNSEGSFIQISKFSTHQTPHYTEKSSVIKAPPLQEIAGDGSGSAPVDGGGVSTTDSGKSPPIKRGEKPPDSLIPDSLIPELKALSGSTPDAAPPKASKANGQGNGAYSAEAEQVLDYLNRATGHTYRFRNPKGGKLSPNATLIIARLVEGYTAQQLREVVHLKTSEWRADEKMVKFLRPQTLFGAQKFAQYVGELEPAG